MATVMHMRWEGVTEDQYEQAREKVGWDREIPEGAKLHIAGFSDGGLNVLDVWASAEAFGAFNEQRLGSDRQSRRSGSKASPTCASTRCTPASRRL